MATRRFRNWFFLVTNVLRLDGTMGGVRLRTEDKPTQATMQDLAESITFKNETGDRAKTTTGSADLGTEQGLVVLATNAQAKSNAAQLSDRSLVVQPSQLPTSENENADPLEDMPIQTMEILPDATTTRNRYKFKIGLNWLNWLVSRIFKQGGIASDVPMKVNGTDYNWAYKNVGDDTVTVNKIANNTNFINTLLSNTSFLTAITNSIVNNNPLAFTDSMPVGTILTSSVFSAGAYGAKWLEVDGAVLLKASYPDLNTLYSGASYPYGSAATTFNLPDYTGRVLRGQNGTTFPMAISSAVLDTVTLAANQIPSLSTSVTITGTTNSGQNTNTDGTHTHSISSTIQSTALVALPTIGGIYPLTGPIAGTPGPFASSPDPLGSDHFHTLPQLSLTGSGTGTYTNGALSSIDTRDTYIVQTFYIKVLK